VGFQSKKKAFRLKFADPEMAGLEVTARSLTTGQFLDLQASMADKADEGSVRRMIELLASRLESWNLEDEETGMPVPATLDGILAQELDFTMAIINAWSEAVAGVSAPLAGGSNSGGTSPELSIPMEALSPSLAS